MAVRDRAESQSCEHCNLNASRDDDTWANDAATPFLLFRNRKEHFVGAILGNGEAKA